MSARDDILKKIDSAVKRKKDLSTQLSREKTLLFWVSSFFKEMEKIGPFDIDGNFAFTATCSLRDRVRTLDKNAYVYYKPGDDSNEPRVVIVWSAYYVSKNNCEAQTVYDISTALMQQMLE